VKTAGRVVVVGTLNVDVIWQVPALPRPGQTIMATAVQRQFGGKGANQAVAAARQGAMVRLIGAMGDDAEGASYRDYLRREGIDLTHVSVVSGVSTGTAHVYVDPSGENVIVVDAGANARFQISPGAATDVLAEGRVVLVQLECGLPAAVGALEHAAQKGVRSILNASPSHAGFPWGELPIDTLIVNEHECHDCCGRTPDDIQRLSASERRELLGSRCVNHVVITQGAAPTLHVTSERVMQTPTLPVKPVDTVGAGDTFAGALAAELAAGREWDAAIRHANVAAALSTLKLGAQAAMPTRSQVEAVLGLT
jgi:ribokinase